MEREPLQQLIERSIRDNVIDGHAIDQDGSNVLIIGEEIHYCSDEGARAFLASRSERPTAGSQSGNGQITADDEQDADDEWSNGGGDVAEAGDERPGVSGIRRGAEETYRDRERPEARRAEPRSPDINRLSTRSGEMSPEAGYSAAPAGGTSSAGFVSRASIGAIA